MGQSPFRRWATSIVLVTLLAGGGVAQLTAQDQTRTVTGVAFDRSVRLPIMITREEIALRTLLRQLAEQREVAIYLDRRIDPSSRVDAVLSATSLPEAVEDIVEPLAAGVSVVADTLYVGPRETARTIRTLAAIRQEELREAPGTSARRQRALLRRRATTWPDLTEPRKVLEEFAARSDLMIDGVDQVPHDLWPAGTIAAGNTPETLLLLLMPFDLAFQWQPGLRGIEIVPVPSEIQICRRHRPRGLSPQEAVRRIFETLPRVEAAIVGDVVSACGTLEEHEELEYLIGGRSRPQPQDPAQKPIQDRRFTLKVVRQPASALIRTLKAQGIEVNYDEAAFAAANIDLEAKISLELKQVTAEEFFTAIGEELGLRFRLSSEGVTFFPVEQ